MHPKSLQIALKGFVMDLYLMFKPHWVKVLYVLSVTILIAQIAVIGSFAVKNQDDKAVTYTFDNDASRAISTAEKTRWWNSNHFAPYGPLYYRIAHTIASIVPYDGPEDYHSVISSERTHSLALQLASLCALYGWAFLVCSILLPLLWQRLFLTTLMVSALTNSFWANMILRPHPDMVLALTAGLATFATARWIYEEKDELEKWSALAWGVAVGTKASVVLFTPAFIFLFFPWNKLKLIQGLKYAGWMLLGYTLIGFPQSLSYGKVLSFLLSESAVSTSADMGSLKLWFWLLKDQVMVPFALGLFVIVLTSKKEIHLENRKALRLFIFCLIPFLVILSRKHMHNPEHFTMPFYSCLLIGSLFILRKMTTQHGRPLFLLAFLMVPTIPPTFQKYFDKHQVCKPEAREYSRLLTELQKNGQFIVHDPYTPVSMIYPNTSKEVWAMRFEDLKDLQPKVLGLNRIFYRRYLRPAPKYLWKKELDEWQLHTAFYKEFAGKDSTELTDGSRWKKTYENACGMELWMRESP